MLYWLLEDPDLPRIGVWSLEHESDKTLWGAQGSMKRAELLPGILEKMRTEMFSDRASPTAMPRQLCWIAHSEGGNVVKTFLQHCQLQRSGNSRRSQVAHSILEATQAVYFIDTPHRGSWLARGVLYEHFGLTPRVRELREGDPGLRELNSWYVASSEGLGVRSLSFCQAEARFKVVGTASAQLERAANGNVAIDRDHNQIAKPSAKAENPYCDIRADLVALYAEASAALAPVASAPTSVDRQTVQKATFQQEPRRLLIFVTTDLIPRSGRLPAVESYDLRFWIVANGLESPRSLNQSDHYALPWQKLAPAIADVYDAELNEEKGGRLLPVLFLPAQILAGEPLYELLADLRRETCERLPHSTGMPVLLACSSRWPLGSSQDRLQATRHLLRKASGRLVENLFSAPNTTLAELAWLRIADCETDDSRPVPPPFSPDGPQAVCGFLHGQELDQLISDGKTLPSTAPLDAVDPLVDRDALSLCWRSWDGALPTNQRLRMEHLLGKGIPMIWRELPAAFPGDRVMTAAREASHPLDTILGWSGLTFLGWFYRYCSEPPGTIEERDSAVRQYIRHSTLFWEDHRHIPGSRSAAPLKPSSVNPP